MCRSEAVLALSLGLGVTGPVRCYIGVVDEASEACFGVACLDEHYTVLPSMETQDLCLGGRSYPAWGGSEKYGKYDGVCCLVTSHRSPLSGESESGSLTRQF